MEGGISTVAPVLTRAELAREIRRKVGLPYSECLKLVGEILGDIACELEKGLAVKISLFGTFSVRDKRGRIGRNPRTGQEVFIDPRRVLSFRPSNKLRERVVRGVAGGESS